jgi:hypothetical protein
MKRRFILGSLLVALVASILLPVSTAGARIALRLQANDPQQVVPSRDLADLLNFPADVLIQDLAGSERERVVTALMDRPEAVQLRMAMAHKGFFADLARAEAMGITIWLPDGTTRTIEATVVPMGPGMQIFLPVILRNYPGSAVSLPPAEPGDEAPTALQPEELSAYLVAMVADDETSFFQAHHTNLDPELAEVLDPPILYNNIPYFYITTLRVVGGRIVYWRYWWFDSHHHPNWYFACYQHYWDYTYRTGADWPWWHQWVYGWYYWRFWYFWSTWFPWVIPIAG